PDVPVEIREGDLLAPLAGERCRAIVSNPPYLTEAEYLELDPAVRDFEPRRALVSGSDGLDATRSLLGGAAALLAPGGLLARDIERAAQENREPPREQVEQYDRALQSVQSNAVYQQVVAAQANFEKLMAKVNARIYEGMKQGAASPIITLG